MCLSTKIATPPAANPASNTDAKTPIRNTSTTLAKHLFQPGKIGLLENDHLLNEFDTTTVSMKSLYDSAKFFNEFLMVTYVL